MARACMRKNAVTWRETDPGIVDRLLVGAIDLHCHSGPSVMPRSLNHVDAIREAQDAGMHAVLFTDTAQAIADLEALLA